MTDRVDLSALDALAEAATAEETVAKACDALLDDFVKRAEKSMRKVSEAVYEELLYMVQDYLKQNAHWNLANDIERCNRIERESLALKAEIEALRAFKAYVHERLDAAEVPTHPEGPHSAEGCRVGDRLDLALAPWEECGGASIIAAEREACARLADEAAAQNRELSIKQHRRSNKQAQLGMEDEADQTKIGAQVLDAISEEATGIAYRIRNRTPSPPEEKKT